MNNLPEIIEHNGHKAVSARELYLALGFEERNWAHWYKKNITNSSFALENQDWAPFVFKTSGDNQEVTNARKYGNFSKDFALTLDFAKRLSMMARTQKGEEVRQYFLRCEQAIKSLIPDDDVIILKAVGILQQRTAQLEAKVIQQQQVLEKQQPKVEYVDQVLASATTITTTQIAKELGISAYALNKILNQRKVLFYASGTWVLYAQYQNRGYTRTRTHSYIDGSGALQTSMTTVWTEKGRMFIHNLMRNL